jgi:hypothetical protein
MKFRFWWSQFPALKVLRSEWPDRPHHERCLCVWRFRLTIGYN